MMPQDKIPKMREKMKSLPASYAFKEKQASRYGKVTESQVNRQFFDRHANIGMMDNKEYSTRELMQCPVEPAHKFGTRKKKQHTGGCERASGLTIRDCEINEKYHPFRSELAAEHYRFCSTLLLLKYRFENGWPPASYYERDFRRYSIDRWSPEEAEAVKVDLLGRQPWVRKASAGPDSKWYLRDTEDHQMEMTGMLLEDICADVKQKAEKIKADLDKRIQSWPLPNFYRRRPPRLETPLYKKVEMPSAPPSRRDSGLGRLRFDLEAWLKSDCEHLKASDFPKYAW